MARNLNQLDNAELLYRQILGRNPKYVLAYVGLVDLLRTRANWAEAAKWQAARLDVETNPDVEETAKLGELLLHAGEPDLAEKALLSALEREPYCYLAHRTLADIYGARKDWEKAIENFEFVVRYEPDADPVVYTSLAAVYRETGKPARAAAILRKGLRLFPDNAALKAGVQSH